MLLLVGTSSSSFTPCSFIAKVSWNTWAESLCLEDGFDKEACYNSFSECISAIKNEPLIQRSPKGKEVTKVLDYLEKCKDCVEVCEVVPSLCKKIYSCLLAGRHIARPSTAQAVIWSKYHEMRCSESLKQLWKVISFPEALSESSELALQIITDRLLKQMIRKEASTAQSQDQASCSPVSLTTREKSAIRYMAGYVAISLTRIGTARHQRISISKKSGLLVLRSMRVHGPFEAVGCVEDYTRVWTELIDRGGLCHIDDKVL